MVRLYGTKSRQNYLLPGQPLVHELEGMAPFGFSIFEKLEAFGEEPASLWAQSETAQKGGPLPPLFLP